MNLNQAEAGGVSACCNTAAAPHTTQDLRGLSPASLWGELWRRTDKPLFGVLSLALGIALLIPGQLLSSLSFTGAALLHIAPWIAGSVVLAAYAHASQAEQAIALAFSGHPVRMLTLAALLGAVSPFCSCGVVPLIAGLLSAGVPFAPVMAFWISSPLMDPSMFAMTAASLGVEFAVVKTLAAISMGLFAGAITHVLIRRGAINALLRSAPVTSCCAPKPVPTPKQWKVWQSAATRHAFCASLRRNIWFLGPWMTIAFLLESLMLVYLPAEKITTWLGQGDAAIPLAVAIGIPSYLNGYAALPLVSGLISLGMSPAVALAFLVAGGVTSLPAMAAVWGLVKPRVFALYLALALTGALGVAYAYAGFLNFRAIL